MDGELEPTRAAALAGHLEHCAECQSLAKELRLVSGRMLNFEIEPAPANLGPAVLTENAAHRPEMTKAAGSGWSGASRWWELIATRKVWAFGAAFAMVLVVAGIASISELRRSRIAGIPRCFRAATRRQQTSRERARCKHLQVVVE